MIICTSCIHYSRHTGYSKRGVVQVATCNKLHTPLREQAVLWKIAHSCEHFIHIDSPEARELLNK